MPLAANQNQQDTLYMTGCIYFEVLNGNYDIEKAIHFFKEVSSCNQYENNLGVINKTGKGVEKDISKSIEYFKDAVNQNNDPIAMFNLAHIYFYDEVYKKYLSKSLKLLIKASIKDIPGLFELLYLVSANKFEPLNEM